MGTSRFRGSMTMSPETVTTRFTKGIPSQTASPTAAQVAALNTAQPTEAGSPPGGTWRPVRA